MKTIYIAGKISGLPMKITDLKFRKATEKLKLAGFDAINPVELVQDYLFENHKTTRLTDNEIWKIAMQVCIKKLVDCDGVLLLSDYHESRGATIERNLARDLDIPAFHSISKFQDLWNN